MSRKSEEARELWRERIVQQEQSVQSVRAFCREHEISEPSFYYWRQRWRKENTPVLFALVETKAVEGKLLPMELALASGDHLRIPGNAATLRMVLSVLREQ